MVTLRKFRNFIVSALALTVLTMPLYAQSPESDQLLKSIPGDALFCVRINNFNNSLGQMDQFLTGISPVGVSMLIKAQLTNLLGSPQLAGLNMDGSFAAFGTILSSRDPMPAGMPNVFIGVLAPVSNYKQFIDGISSKTPADANGIVKVLSLGNPVILVTQYGNYALCAWANEYDNLMRYKSLMNVGTGAAPKTQLLRSAMGSPEARQAVTEPFWMYANIQQVSKAFGPLISSGIAGIKATLQNIPATNTGMSPEGLQNIMNMYVNIIETILKEVKSVSLSMNPTPTVLNLTKMTTAVPGTEIAKMLATNPVSEQNNLLPYLEDDAMMNVAFMLNSPFLKQAIDLEVNLISVMSGKSADSEELQKMKSIADNMTETVKGPAVYTISVDPNMTPPFKGNYIIAVKDTEKFQKLMNESIQMMTTMGFLDIYKSMGLEANFNISKNVETYKGVTIDSAKLSMKFTEANTPQAQMLDKMYGGGFEYRWGMVKDLFAITIGTDAEASMHKLIDKIQAGGATQQLAPEIKNALSLVPGAEKADFFATFNLLRVFRMISGIMTTALPAPFPSINVQSSSNFVVDGKASDGILTVHVALPKEHLQEIMRAIITIQQEAMKNQPRPAGT
jgi:hypothetical protein